MAKSFAPPTYSSVSPYIMVVDATRLIAFLKETAGAELRREPMRRDDGSIKHAELQLGYTVIMISDATAEYPAGKSMTYIYVKNVDAAYKTALSLGAVELMPPTDCDHGERMGGVTDHSGNQWWFGEPIKKTGKAT